MHGCDYILCCMGNPTTKRRPFVSVKFVETPRQADAARKSHVVRTKPQVKRKSSRRGGGNIKERVPLLGSYLAQGTLQLGFSSEENFFSRNSHISSSVSMVERAFSTGQTFEGSLEDFTSSMSSSA